MASLDSPRVRVSLKNVCHSSVGSVPGTLDDPVRISSSITVTNQELGVDTESACVQLARVPDAMNLVLNRGVSASSFVVNQMMSANTLKVCVKCGDTALEVVDHFSPKIGPKGRRNFKNIYPGGLHESDAVLGLGVVPFGGHFHVSCVNKSRLTSDSVLGTTTADHTVENCRFYGLVYFRRFKTEEHNRVGLGCIQCQAGFTGPVFYNPDYQFLNGVPGDDGFFQDCATPIPDFDSSQQANYIGTFF